MNEDIPIFDQSNEPFNLVISSKSIVYCLEVDLYMLAYVLKSFCFMYDSNIENIIDEVYNGGNIISDEIEKQKEALDNQEIGVRKCRRCGITCHDFFLQKKKGCPICWLEFKNEIDIFLRGVRENIGEETLNSMFPSVNDSNIDSNEYEMIESGLPELQTNIRSNMDNHGKILQNAQPIEQIHSMLKEKEQIFREKFRDLDNSIKDNYSKFVSRDPDYMQSQVKKTEERIIKLINEGKFEAAEILNRKNDAFKNKLKND